MTRKENIRAMLAVGRHRMALGCVCEVAALLLKDGRKVRQVAESMCDEDAGVANRAADALERASYFKPKLLAPWKDLLIGLLAEAEQNKLRWNLALMITRLSLTAPETLRVAAVLNTYLDDKSSIVKTAAMHGLAGMARQNPALRSGALDLLRMLSRSGTPAMRARGRILLKALETAKDGRVFEAPKEKARDPMRDPRMVGRRIAGE